MIIDIQTRGFGLTDALSGYVRERLETALGRHQSRVSHLRVRLSDINGPRGGADKRCEVVVGLAHTRDVVVQNVEPDMYAAISRAIRRAGVAVGRRVSKRRSCRPRPPAADIAGADVSMTVP